MWLERHSRAAELMLIDIANEDALSFYTNSSAVKTREPVKLKCTSPGSLVEEDEKKVKAGRNKK